MRKIIKEVTLQTNGLRIIAMERHISPIIGIQLWIGAGSVDEEAKISGCAHLLEHMLPLSTSKSIYRIRYIKEIGGILNCGTRKEFTLYSLICSNSYINDAFDFIVNLLNPSFNAEVYKKEKNVVMDEILLDTTIPKLDAILWKEAFKGSPYERPVKGTLSSIRGIKITDIKNYFENYYVPNNVTIVIVGDFNADNILKIAEDKFGLMEPKSYQVASTFEVPALTEARRVLIKGPTRLAYMKIGWLIPNINSPARYPLEVLKSLIRYGKDVSFSRNLRYQYLLSNIVVNCHFLKNGGLFVIETTSEPKRVEETENRVVSGMSSLEDEIDEEKVTNEKTMVEYEHVTKFLKCFDIVSLLGYTATLMGHVETYDTFMSNLQAVTKEDVLEVLRNYFENTPYVTVVYTPGDITR